MSEVTEGTHPSPKGLQPASPQPFWHPCWGLLGQAAVGLTLPLLALICGIPEVVKGAGPPSPSCLAYMHLLEALKLRTPSEEASLNGIKEETWSAWSAHLSAQWSTPAGFAGDGLALAPSLPCFPWSQFPELSAPHEQNPLISF